jgi:hypothetical protein
VSGMAELDRRVGETGRLGILIRLSAADRADLTFFSNTLCLARGDLSPQMPRDLAASHCHVDRTSSKGTLS